MLDPVLHFNQLNLQFLELAFVKLTLQFDICPLRMLSEIIEDRRRPVGVIGIKANIDLGRVICGFIGLLGFAFVFAHGGIANKGNVC